MSSSADSVPSSSPASSFCRFRRISGGTRTFGHPQGTTPTPSERAANAWCVLWATLFGVLLSVGKFPMVLSTAPDGSYPKVWDLPAWQTVLRRSDVEVTPLDQCAHGAESTKPTRILYFAIDLGGLRARAVLGGPPEHPSGPAEQPSCRWLPQGHGGPQSSRLAVGSPSLHHRMHFSVSTSSHQTSPSPPSRVRS